MVEKREQLTEQARKLEQDQRIAAAEADVRTKKDKLEEARKHYDNALASDTGTVSVPQEGPEVVRTRTLAEQAEQELAEAEDALKDLKKGEGAQPTV